MILLIHCYQITRHSLSQYDEKSFLSAMFELLKSRFFLILAFAFLLLPLLLNDQINGKFNALLSAGTLKLKSDETLKEKKFMILMSLYFLDFVLQIPLNFITRKSRAVLGEDTKNAFRELILLFFLILALGIIASYHINLFFAVVLFFIPLINVIFCHCCKIPSSVANDDTRNQRKEKDNYLKIIFKRCFGLCFHPFAVHLIIFVAVKIFNQNDRYDSIYFCVS
jgi:hypothetical protein